MKPVDIISEIHDTFSSSILPWLPEHILKNCLIQTQTQFLHHLEDESVKRHCVKALHEFELPSFTMTPTLLNMTTDTATDFFNQSINNCTTTLIQSQEYSKMEVYSTLYAYILVLSKCMRISYDDEFSLQIAHLLEAFSVDVIEERIVA